MPDLLPARSTSRCCSTALGRNSTSSTTSLMTSAPACPNLPGVGLLSDPRSPLSVPALSASASEVTRRAGRWQTVRECAAHPRVRPTCAEHYRRSTLKSFSRACFTGHSICGQHRCLVNHKHVRAFWSALESLKVRAWKLALRNSFTLASVGERMAILLPQRPRSRCLLEQMRFPGSSNPERVSTP